MSLMDIFDITGAAMSAQSVRLNTTASNLANADTVGKTAETTYRARQPVFAALMAESRQDMHSTTPEGVSVQVLGIVEKSGPLAMEYNPGHPMANEKGYIYRPNVNTMEEMANMIEASRAYQVDAELANTVKELALRTLSIG